MPSEYEQELSHAIHAVIQAMAVCRRVQFAITDEVLEKDDNSPVTIADFASQAVVCRALDREFPFDAIIGEEDSTGLKTPEQAPFVERIIEELSAIGLSSTPDEICDWVDLGCAEGLHKRFWTLDPIDGTKGFLRGQQYAISLALIVEGEIQVAVLGCPNLDPNGGEVCREDNSPGALFYAIKDHGAFVVSPDDLANPKLIHVKSTTTPELALVCESVESGHTSKSRSQEMAELLGIKTPSMKRDSQAKYAAVARGEADIYLRLPSRKGYREKIWDHAGGVLIVEEAGGRVTDVHGRDLDFRHGDQLKENQGVIVTNRLLHNAVLEAYKTVSESEGERGA